MTDVIKLAKERRARLVAEVAKLDSFLRIARELAESGGGLSPDAGLLGSGGAAELDDELILTDMLPENEEFSSTQVGKMIRHRRWMMGMTHDELSGLVHRDVQEIQEYESGVRQISSEVLRDIAIAMRVPMSFFLREPGEEGLPGDEFIDQLITES
jgi:hypothetical protein